MKTILLAFIILFSLNSCEDNSHKVNKEKEALAQKRANMLLSYQKELEERKVVHLKEEKKITSSKTGIMIKDGTFSIDTNKTKAFIKGLSEQLDMKIDNIKKDLSKGIIKNKEAGIDISPNGVNIDLNKTKAVISHWSKEIENFVKTFDDKTETNKTK